MRTLAPGCCSILSLTLALAAQQPAPGAAPRPAPASTGDALRHAFVEPDGDRRMAIAAAADEVLAADKDGRARFMATLRAIAAAAPAPPPAGADPATGTPAPASAPGETKPPELPAEVRALMATAVTDAAAQRPTLAKLAADARHGPAALVQLRERADAILARCVATFVRKKLETNATFAGQYAELRDFLPEVGALLLAWAKQPPRDVANPQQFRTACLRALRDTLTAEAATDRVRADLRELATKTQDGGGGSDELFVTAICALHQYGDPAMFDEMRAQLEKQAQTAERPESRASALAMLADLWYQLRDYARAAASYKAFVAAAEKLQPQPRGLPVMLYNAACSLSLAGDVDEALQYLERALAAGAAAEQPLRKVLLDSDHDLDNLRKDARFATLYERYFGGGRTGR